MVVGNLRATFGDAFRRTSNEYITTLRTVSSRTRLTRTSKIVGTNLTIELVEGNELIIFEPEAEGQDEGYLSVAFIWIKAFVSIYDEKKDNYPISRFLLNFLRHHVGQ